MQISYEKSNIWIDTRNRSAAFRQRFPQEYHSYSYAFSTLIARNYNPNCPQLFSYLQGRGGR
jgi:hypothetical protein